MIKNEEIFSGKANIYKNFRSSYPKELIEYLYKIGLSKDSVIADIGSGTGIFSRLLLEKGSQVYCVEPNDEMRILAETDFGDSSVFKNFISINAPAENTSLADKSVDFVTVAQAFQWFNVSLFKTECLRILKDSGKVVLVWNIRDYNSEFIKKDYIIRKKYSVGKKDLGTTYIPEDIHNFYSVLSKKNYEEKTFKNDLILNRKTYVGMNLSRSYSPCENKHPYIHNELVKELNEIFDNYSIHGYVSFSQFTKCYVGNI